MFILLIRYWKTINGFTIRCHCSKRYVIPNFCWGGYIFQISNLNFRSIMEIVCWCVSFDNRHQIACLLPSSTTLHFYFVLILRVAATADLDDDGTLVVGPYTLSTSSYPKRGVWPSFGILQTWSIIFGAILLNQQINRQKCIVVSLYFSQKLTSITTIYKHLQY